MGKLQQKKEKNKEKNKEKHPISLLPTLSLPLRATPQTEDRLPQPESQFCPSFHLAFFSAYLQGFRTAVFLSDEKAVFPPAVLQFFVVRLFQYQY